MPSQVSGDHITISVPNEAFNDLTRQQKDLYYAFSCGVKSGVVFVDFEFDRHNYESFCHWQQVGKRLNAICKPIE